MILTNSTAAEVGTSNVNAIASATASFRQFMVYAATTISAAITGTTGLIKNGIGTLTLSGNNTYTGATTINAGTLAVNNSYLTPSYTINSGAVLNLGYGPTASLTLLGNGTVNIVSVLSAIAPPFTISMSGGLIDIKSTGGLSYGFGNDPWTGNLADLNVSGVLYIAANNVIVNALTGNSTFFTVGASTIIVGVNNGGGTYTGTLTRNYADASFRKEGSGTQTLNGTINLGTTGTITQIGSGNLVINGAILSGSIVQNGTGTLTLSGSNTYTGATTISVGTLALGASNVIADTSNVSVASGSTFALGGFSDTIGKLSGAGSVALGSGALTTTYGSGSGTFSGVISGNGSFTLAGTADYNAYLTISGSNTYTGATNVNGATLILGANNVLSNSSTLNISGGRFSASNRNQTLHSVTMTSGVIERNGGSLTFNNASSLTGGNVNIGNDGGSIVTGGTTTLGNVTFTYNATLGGFNALVLGGDVVVTSGAAALFVNGPAGGQGYVKLGNTNRIFDVGAAANLNINWVITSDILSAGALTKNGTGTLTLTGVNAYTGATSISAGSIIVPKTTGASTATATFSATLSVSFNVSPPSGTTTFRFFPGATTNSYASVTLVGVPVGTTATYASATSTLSVIVP